MDQIISLVRQFIDLFRIWCIVAPWEQAVRVRFGKNAVLLNAGVHFRIPIFDQFYVQSTRMRWLCTSRQTLMTKDGKTVMLNGMLGYSVIDVLRLHNTLYHAEDTIRNMTQAAIADATTPLSSVNLNCEIIAKLVLTQLSLTQYGIGDVQFSVNELAITKTYRLVGDYAGTYSSGTTLSTEKPT